jgi:hypothetical protein
VRDALSQQNATRTRKLDIPEITPSLQSELGAPLPLHISLSRTLQLKNEDREDFLETLKASLRRAAVRTFDFEFEGLKWVPNFERNRWFLVLGIKKPENDELNRLLQACNEASQSSGHPALYTGSVGDGPMEDHSDHIASKRAKCEQGEDLKLDRSGYFHVSIAWNLEEPDPEWLSLVRRLDTRKYIQVPEAAFDAIKIRVGNAVHNIALGTKRCGLGQVRGGLGFG